MKQKSSSESGFVTRPRAVIIRDLPPLYGSGTVRIREPGKTPLPEEPKPKPIKTERKVKKKRRRPVEAIERNRAEAAKRKALSIELFKEGKSCTEISKITGIAYTTVCVYVREINQRARTKGNIDADLIRLYGEGLMQKEIAEKLGITVSNTSQRLSLLRKKGLVGRRNKCRK